MKNEWTSRFIKTQKYGHQSFVLSLVCKVVVVLMNEILSE